MPAYIGPYAAEINAALGGSPTALANLVKGTTDPNVLIQIGNAVAGAMNNVGLGNTATSGTAVANLAAALASSGNANLISGVLAAANLSPSTQTALANAVVASNDLSLIATVAVLDAKDGKTGAVTALATALAKSTNSSLVQSVVGAVQIYAPESNFGSTIVAAAGANTPIGQAAAKGMTQALQAVNSPGIPGGFAPIAVILPSPAQTITGSVN
jgi:hypothetical protein